MHLYLAGNFVIMGKKEKEKVFQKSLGTECYRLAAFFYKHELDIVTELKGEELNESKKEIKKEIPKCRIKRKKAKLIRKTKNS